MASDNHFFVLHPFDHTHFPTDPRKSPSTIDLIITNGHIPINTPETVCLGSDHNAVKFQILLNDKVTLCTPTQKPSFKDANWQKYQDG